MRRKDREVTDLGTIKDIISKCKTCHIAMIDGNNMPYVVPISYGFKFEGKKLIMYFHCANEGKKIDILKSNNNVCFELCIEGENLHPETPCISGYYYSSVIGFGKASFIEDSDKKCEALYYIVKQQMKKDVTFNEKQAEPVCVFSIETEDYSGKVKPIAN